MLLVSLVYCCYLCSFIILRLHLNVVNFDLNSCSHFFVISYFQLKPTQPWFSGILSEEDFELVNPHRAVFLRQLRDLASRKQRILKDRTLSDDQKNVQLAELALPNSADPSSGIRLEDLG